MKSHSGEQVNLLGSCLPVKGISYERNVICSAVSNEDMILALVMGSNPVESPEFFRFMRRLLKLSSKCEDHIFI